MKRLKKKVRVRNRRAEKRVREQKPKETVIFPPGMLTFEFTSKEGALGPVIEIALLDRRNRCMLDCVTINAAEIKSQDDLRVEFHKFRESLNECL